jgi:hypothetical protein
MSRAMNLKLSTAEVVKKCEASGVAISDIDTLPSGDTHLVCVTSEGAAEMRRKFGKHIADERQRRFAFLPVPPHRR